jgi:hypothetical protein
MRIARVEPLVVAVLVSLQTPAVELDLLDPAGTNGGALPGQDCREE